MLKIKCPNCQSILSIKKSIIEAKGELVIACPKCSHKLRLKAKPKQLENQIEFTTPKTRVVGLNTHKVELVLVAEEQEFLLNQPYQTFGRASTSVQANLMFKTTDKSISRKHCIFRTYSDGITIEDCSKAGLFLNGERLPVGEEKYIEPGDEIQMGSVLFTIKSSNEN